MSTRNAAKKRSESPAQPKVTLLDIDTTLKSLAGQIRNIDDNQGLLNAKIENSVERPTKNHFDLSAKLNEVTPGFQEVRRKI
jgi:hypothetical protein